tara:strand:- start:14991 stop:15833 length:843 start_codon:yes stop_codon:yes gene_type:complete
MNLLNEHIDKWIDGLNESLEAEAYEKFHEESQDIAKSEYAKRIMETNKDLEDKIAINKKELNRVALSKAIASEEERKMKEQDNKGYLEFLKALEVIQSKGLGVPVKEMDKNDFHENTFFNIDTTTKILQEGLKGSGFVYRFRNRYQDETSFLDLLVTHVPTGYTEISTRKYYNFDRLKAHEHNGTETYYKRQMLLSFFSIKGEKDDDGNSISLSEEQLKSIKPKNNKKSNLTPEAKRAWKLLKEKHNGGKIPKDEQDYFNKHKEIKEVMDTWIKKLESNE